MADPTRRAVVLLSGGMDSAVSAAAVRANGYEVHALSVEYGQRQEAEVDAAERVAKALGLASFRRVRVDLGTFGGSALTTDAAVPKDRAEIGGDIPPTYVPARNTVFLSVALAAAEAMDADAIAIGVNAVDYSGYPDCRPAFLDAFREVSAQGTKRGVEGDPIRVLAPLVNLTKREIVEWGLKLSIPFADTLSCYDPIERDGHWLHCGHCDACRLRSQGFGEAGAEDPTPYA